MSFYPSQTLPSGDLSEASCAIAFSLPGEWVAEILLGWWANARLEDMFRYRHEGIKCECKKAANS